MTGKTILLVEDDEFMCELMTYLLESQEHHVDVVRDGLTARDKLSSSDAYDLILLDWDLPGLNGFDVCKSYRSSGGASKILMLTGMAESLTKENFVDSGATDILAKPFDQGQLN